VTRRRIDAALVDRGLFESRERARAALLAGDVRVNGIPVTKAGQAVDADAVIEVAERQRFVSRGGEKLSGALDVFGCDVTGVRAIDVGASTGGFTDCLLQRGAASVVALDVGYGQLAWSLRTDERVTVVERTNIRATDPEELGAPFDLAVVDARYPLRAVMPHVVGLRRRRELIALVALVQRVRDGKTGGLSAVRPRASGSGRCRRGCGAGGARADVLAHQGSGG
jgi:23S rRNA (cytidine1920-2'-O)/16S rRNA (cytidine1409-2'-O)-methyltransferase